MTKVITIHEAKTHLSRYINQAKAGQKIYLGSYRKPEVMLVRVDKSQKPPKRQLGIWKDRKDFTFKDSDIIGPDPDIISDFEASANQSLPK